ncbi:MAG: HAD-IC family P-type ATPase, partial [Steroidobacteraceae bacterium]
MIGNYWAQTAEQVLRELQVDPAGLTSDAAAERLRLYGPNLLHEERSLSRLRVLGRQLASPLLFLLIFAAAVSAATGSWANAVIVLSIVFASAFIGYRREYSAHVAAAELRIRVKTRTRVWRDGHEQLVLLEEVVPGDIVLLSAGNLVPADMLILEANDCYVSQSVLTGESFPVEKAPAVVAMEAPLAARSNCVYMGTNVRSGTLRGVVVATGEGTQFGGIANRLSLRPPETEFERGSRRFGYLLTSAMLIIVVLVFVAQMLAGRPLVDTLLFSVALAVGLSPELLPAILSVNLARGAEMMARHGVLVRHLS